MVVCQATVDCDILASEQQVNAPAPGDWLMCQRRHMRLAARVAWNTLTNPQSAWWTPFPQRNQAADVSGSAGPTSVAGSLRNRRAEPHGKDSSPTWHAVDRYAST